MSALISRVRLVLKASGEKLKAGSAKGWSNAKEPVEALAALGGAAAAIEFFIRHISLFY